MSEKNLEKQVTIVFIQRERFSATPKGLESLIANTKCDYQLICVDGNSPDQIRDYLQKKCVQLGCTLLRSDDYLTPNEARNAAMKYVSTPYIAFVDNDINFSDGWLEALVKCAEETGAWLVGPLYLEGNDKGSKVHMYGGKISVDDTPSGKNFCERHHLAHKEIDEVASQLVRKATGLLEFHTMLARTDVFKKLGPLDSGLMTVKEHSDLCYAVTNAGGSIYLEPTSQIIYNMPDPSEFDEYDRDYYCFRWSYAWTRETIQNYSAKYDISSNSLGIKIQKHWCNKHRRKISAPFTRIRKLLGEYLFNLIDSTLIAPIELFLHIQSYSYEQCVKNRKPTINLVEKSLPSRE